MPINFFTIQKVNSVLFATGEYGNHSGLPLRQAIAAAGVGALSQHWTLMNGDAYVDLHATDVFAGGSSSGTLVRFINRATGQAVTTAGPVTGGTLLEMFEDNTGDNQQWLLKSVAPPDEHFFHIVAKNDPMLVWDVPDASTASGQQLQIFKAWPQAADNQTWTGSAVFQANLPFMIQCKADNTVLDVPGFSTMGGQAIQHYEANAGLNQLWMLEPAANPGLAGGFFIRSVSSGRVLDVPADADNPPGQIVNVQQFQKNPGDPLNQIWALRDAGDGYVKIQSGYSPEFVIDAKVNGDDYIQVYEEHGGADNQKWKFIPVSWASQNPLNHAGIKVFDGF